MGARELLAQVASAGFSVAADGGRLIIRPASRLTDEMRDALRDAKPVLLALLAGDEARADADSRRYLDRVARLRRWGWPEPDSEKLAERLTLRDRGDDDRVSCIDCQHYRPGRCGNHRRAGMSAPDVGRDLAAMLQRCKGFAGD